MQNRYPLWKNVTLVLVALVAFIYTIPNLYSEEPAVQISSALPIDPIVLEDKVSRILDVAKIHPQSIATQDTRLEVRFSSTDAQLHARDVIKSSLGEGFTVALNLLPSTPAWLVAIGASPMKQGLDLRGGVHFLLEVDVESVVSRRYEGLMKEVGLDLREAGIRYSGLHYVPNKGITILLKSEELRNQTYALLKQKYSTLKLSKPKSSLMLSAQLSEVELNNIRQSTIEQTMGILR